MSGIGEVTTWPVTNQYALSQTATREHLTQLCSAECPEDIGKGGVKLIPNVSVVCTSPPRARVALGNAHHPDMETRVTVEGTGGTLQGIMSQRGK